MVNVILYSRAGFKTFFEKSGQYKAFVDSIPNAGWIPKFLPKDGIFSTLVGDPAPKSLVGYLRFLPMETPNNYFIRTVTVVPELRRKGYCYSLMNESMFGLQALKGMPLNFHLNVRPGNIPAVSSYTKLGFEIEKEIWKNDILYYRMVHSSGSWHMYGR
jgi:ribosomal protein S18 acetylase RimI-like enzyme